jgi:hypothetical protein
MGWYRDYHDGDVSLATLVGTLTDKVQASPGGRTGILTFNIEAMWTHLDETWGAIGYSQNWQAWNNVNWARYLSDAWLDGMTQGSISDSTDTDAVWDCSENEDTNTNHSVPATIPNLNDLYDTLYADLLAIAEEFRPGTGQTNETAKEGVVQMATAFRKAIANALFVCIGLKHSGITCIEVPLTRTAL